ncbi:MAG TPA: hypothetical protein VN820_00845 [Acidimicrobiales bacterium]|nr:hypothetical protein [Acidimicrobiales bacterium]
MASPVMVHLTMVGSAFEARVVMARLGAEGILTQLSGTRDGPYPLPGPVEVLVMADQADEARELLLADKVEALFDDLGDGATATEDGGPGEGGSGADA